MPWRLGQLAFASLVSLVLAAPVRAEPSAAAHAPTWLTWRTAGSLGDGEASCLDSDAFEASLSQRLGEDAAAVAHRVGLRLTIEVGGASSGTTTAASRAPTAPAIVATFASANGRVIGRRALETPGSTCGAAFDALSISTALFLQGAWSETEGALTVGSEEADARATDAPPEVARDTTRPEPESAAPVEAPPLPRAAPPPVAALKAPASPRAMALGARGGAFVRAGDVPLGLRGLEATLQLRVTAGAPLLFVAAELSPRQHASSDLGIDFSFMLVTGRAGLCPFERRWSSRELALCAALGVGRMSVAGDGLDASTGQERWRVTVDAGAILAQRLSDDWSVAFEPRLVVPFQRDRITVMDATGASGDLFRAAPVGGAAVLSLGYSPGGPEKTPPR